MESILPSTTDRLNWNWNKRGEDGEGQHNRKSNDVSFNQQVVYISFRAKIGVPPYFFHTQFWYIHKPAVSLLARRQVTQDLLLTEMHHLKLRHPIISIDVPSTNPALSCKRATSMQDTPVVEDKHCSRFELLPILIFLLLQKLVKLPRCIVPPSHFAQRKLDGRPITRVPSHLDQLSGFSIMFQHWKPLVRHDTDLTVPARMRMHIHRCQCLVRIFVLIL
jgi:hypothetical protein